MLGWLLVVALVIIWAIFLFPFLRRRRSPVTTVEEFEQKMDFLAETNVAHRGPLGADPPQGRALPRRPAAAAAPACANAAVRCSRCCSRRPGLALLIGLFPPFHRILMGPRCWAGCCSSTRCCWSGSVRSRIASRAARPARVAERSVRRRRQRAGVARTANVAGRAGDPTGTGSRHGSQRASGRARATDRRRRLGDDRHRLQVLEPRRAVRSYVDEDVHIVVHRSDELDLRGLRAARRAVDARAPGCRDLAGRPPVDLSHDLRGPACAVRREDGRLARRRSRRPGVRSAHPRTRSARSIEASWTRRTG